jgi:hypothetical protein
MPVELDSASLDLLHGNQAGGTQSDLPFPSYKTHSADFLLKIQNECDQNLPTNS